MSGALEACLTRRHEFVTPEHLLLALLDDAIFYSTLSTYCDVDNLCAKLDDKLSQMEQVPEHIDYEDPELSLLMTQLWERACQQVYYSSATEVDTTHLIMALFSLDDCWA